MNSEFSAVVLAGGRSSRMGRRKADLPFHGQTMLERIVAELAGTFDDLVIVAHPLGLNGAFRLPHVRIVSDDREYQGPLAALARGLRAVRSDAAFACSCDAALVDAGVARALCGMLEQYDAVIPDLAGIAQPLHAVYRKRCAAAIDAMIARGENRLQKIADSISARKVGEEAMRRLDPELLSLFNVNTPEDYQRALRLARSAARRFGRVSGC